MCIIKCYNGKVLTVNGFYALKCIGTHLCHPISFGHKPLGKTEIPNWELGISVIPMSPEQGIIGHCVVRVRHYGQRPKSENCAKCFLSDHPTWRCVNENACRVCQRLGHREDTEGCPCYCDDDGAIVFRSKKVILSNFHHCPSQYNGIEYATREQAIQHQKAFICNYPTVALGKKIRSHHPGNPLAMYWKRIKPS